MLGKFCHKTFLSPPKIQQKRLITNRNGITWVGLPWQNQVVHIKNTIIITSIYQRKSPTPCSGHWGDTQIATTPLPTECT